MQKAMGSDRRNEEVRNKCPKKNRWVAARAAAAGAPCLFPWRTWGIRMGWAGTGRTNANNPRVAIDRSQMPVGAEALEAAGWPAGEWRCASGHRAPSCSLARTARKGRRGRRVFIPDQPGEIFYWSDELLTSSANVHAVAV